MAQHTWQKQPVGDSGVRRIVPMLGVDYIAGQIQLKGKPYSGGKKASIGGRTRFWSTTNFMSISSGLRRQTPYTASELERQDKFKLVSQTTSLYNKTLPVVQAVTTDLTNNTAREGIYPAEAVSRYNWMWRVIYAFIDGGGTLPQSPTWPLV